MSREKKLELLRTIIKGEGLDCYLLPHTDEWQNEQPIRAHARLRWLTGFTGSNGLAVITLNRALVASDGRYKLQLPKELSGSPFTPAPNMLPHKAHYLIKEVTPKKGLVGYDPKLFTIKTIELLEEQLPEHKLIPIAQNFVDRIWDDPTNDKENPVLIHPLIYAGKDSTQKRKVIANSIKKTGAKALVVTSPDSIAWLLNIRGRDLQHTPVVLSHAILYANTSVDWFIKKTRISKEVSEWLGDDVTIKDPDSLEETINQIASLDAILLDPISTPVWFEQVLKKSGATIKHLEDPIIIEKTIKNQIEQEQIRKAHIKEGVVLVKFWCWVSSQRNKNALSELDIVEKLQALRQLQDGYVMDSFATIAAWNEHAAIIHYTPSKNTNKTITGDGILLVDTGAQYLQGTTDNTRTWGFSNQSKDVKKDYTLVLKGHIALARAKFSKDMTGSALDSLAREALRCEGKEYGHSTGHGVGQFLSVHERGALISSRSNKPLREGMLVSNEPGYYPGAYGIRIENLMLVRKASEDKLCFETVSLTPIDQSLIDESLLDDDEKRWLNKYHAHVYETLKPYLDANEIGWLRRVTKPLLS